MREYLISKTCTLLSVIILLLLPYVCAAPNDDINLKTTPAHQITLKEPLKKDSKSLLIDENADLKALLDEQKTKDLEDLEMLWNATVEKNTLIQFTMKKLSVPENERRIHSSFMAKSVSALVSGASFIPSFSGMNYSLQTASFAAGRLVNNYINKKEAPTTTPLTDTELIELAGMIENLQDGIISSYYNYKSALNDLKQVRTRMVLYNKNYANAIEKGDKLEIIVSSSLYDNIVVDEFVSKEKAKKYQMELERLTSKETIQKLNLYQKDVGDELIDEKLFQGRSTGGGNVSSK